MDHDQDVLQLYHEEVTDDGYKGKGILAKDGKEAQLKYSQERPDLVIMDILNMEKEIGKDPSNRRKAFAKIRPLRSQ